MIAAICTFPRLPCPSTKRRVMLNLTSAAAAAAAAAAVRTAGWSCSVFFFFFQLSCESYIVMDVVQNPQESSGYDQGTTMRKNIGIETPRCATAAVVSAVVLRRLTKEYTHRYSMMHRRLTTAGIEVAPHYHQLLVWWTYFEVLILQRFWCSRDKSDCLLPAFMSIVHVSRS